MKRILYIMVILLTLAGCNRDESHIIIPDDPHHNKGGATVELDVAGLENAKFTDTHIYGFDPSQKLIYHKYYPTQQDLSKETFSLEAGVYTFVAVLNMGKEFKPEVSVRTQTNKAITKTDDELLPELTLNALLRYLKTVENTYPEMLTGMMQQQIETNELAHITIPIKKGTNGIVVSKLTLALTLPDVEFEEFQTARIRATAPHNLRSVVEFYLTGKEVCVSRQTAILTASATAGVYTMDAEIAEGTYDLLMWTDYTESGSTADLCYNTSSLKATHIIATDGQYTTGSDRREAFYGKSTVTITTDGQVTSIPLERPLAKYSLIADDITRYRSLMKTNPDKYPALNELTVAIIYEGYLPCGFNVNEGKPNHSEMGFKYQNPLPVLATDDTEVQVANDYVIVNGTESSVSVTVVVTDHQGRKISQVKGVEIKYKRGMITTVKGDFLTAGVINPGINIDTDWENTHEVIF